jgi:guanylate kinase
MDGKLLIFSAPSGSGKTTIVRKLLSKLTNLEFSVSACSRAMRNGEVNGHDYYFLSPDEFRVRIDNNEFVEWEEVYPGSYYGTLKSELERIWAKGNHVVFDVDVKGGLNLKKIFGERALSIFVMPPSIESLRLRLELRGTETPESLAKREGKAMEEMGYANGFDKIIVNDKLDDAILEAESTVKNFIINPQNT